MNFDQWMYEVDAILEKKYGLVSADLPDQQYADWYDAGVSPVVAAVRAIKSESR